MLALTGGPCEIAVVGGGAVLALGAGWGPCLHVLSCPVRLQSRWLAAAGIREGGRTGITAIMIGGCVHECLFAVKENGKRTCARVSIG